MLKTESTIAELQEQLRQEKIVTNQFRQEIVNLKIERNSLQEKHFELSENVTRMFGVIADLREQLNQYKKIVRNRFV